MNETTIKKALRKGERVTLECKKAMAEVPRSLWETYSAFANTLGGLILLGVDEHSNETNVAKRYEIVGVNDAQKILTDFWNTINSDKVNVNILTDSDVEVINISGKQIVCIHVPMADWRAKPIYLNGNVYKGTFRRNHEGDYHCTEDQVKAMIRDSNTEGNDGILIEYYGMDDIDPNSLRQYRTEFRQENSTHIWNRDDDKTFLRNLGGYIEDRKTGKEGLTLAGLMMFGKGLAIRDRFANFRMDYLDMSHLLAGERYHDRLTYDGLWENNLYQFFRIVSPKVQFDLPRPFKLEKGGRRNDDTPQHEAVREAFTNAIIHCDLLMDAGILRVEKHDDRLCFRNPGLLKLPVETIYRGGNSKARNPKIQNMLRMIGFGENVGSGFPKIVAAWKQTNWGEPLLLNKLDVDEVELVLPVPVTESEESEEVSVNSSDRVSKEWSNWPNDWSKGLSNELSNGLSNTTINIFKMIVADNHISREVLAKKAGISVVSVHKHIKKLKSVGLIKRIGSSRYGHWEVAENKEDGFFATQNIGINGEDVVINDENVVINDGKDVVINGEDVVINVVINDENVGIKLTERQRVILEMIAHNPFLSAKEISEKTSEKTSEKGSINYRTIQRDLTKLKKIGVLTREGAKRNGQWVIANAFVSENDCQSEGQHNN